MSTYDNWKTTTPQDEEEARQEYEAKRRARMEDIIDELESGREDADDAPWN